MASEVFIFKAYNRNVATPDSIYHHVNICTKGLNLELHMVDKHSTTELQSPGPGSFPAS